MSELIHNNFEEIIIGLIHTRTKALVSALFALILPSIAKSDIPLLNSGLTSQNYEVVFLNEPYMAYVSFHRQAHFFIVGSDNSNLIKIDATGHEVFRLAYSSDNFRPRFSSYVTTKHGVYDLSDPQPQLIPITNTYNGEKKRDLRHKAFIKLFAKHYADADVVVYGDFNDDHSKNTIYLRTDNKWTIFYFSSLYIDTLRDYDLGNTIAEFPPKFERMILLSDPVRKRYSYNDYRLRDRTIRLPEDKLRYSRATKLKRRSYKSSSVFREFPYTPIPATFMGISTYRLSVGGENMEFKERATRGIIQLRAESNLSLFVLPKIYEKIVPVSFLEFRPNSNFDTLGSDGLYIIRPKR